MSKALPHLSFRPLPWLASMEIGIPEIDADHQHLVKRTNEVLIASGENRPWPDILQIVRNMKEECVKHFRLEEDYFEAERYPRAEDHIKEHRRIESDLADIIERMEKSGPSEMTIELALHIRFMLIEHLLRFDLGYKSHFLFGRGL